MNPPEPPPATGRYAALLRQGMTPGEIVRAVLADGGTEVTATVVLQAAGMSLVEARMEVLRARGKGYRLSDRVKQLLPDDATIPLRGQQFTLLQLLLFTTGVAVVVTLVVRWGQFWVLSIVLPYLGFLLVGAARRWYAETWVGWSVSVGLMLLGNQLIVSGPFGYWLSELDRADARSVEFWTGLLVIATLPTSWFVVDVTFTTAGLAVLAIIVPAIHAVPALLVAQFSFRRDDLLIQFMLLGQSLFWFAVAFVFLLMSLQG